MFQLIFAVFFLKKVYSRVVSLFFFEPKSSFEFCQSPLKEIKVALRVGHSLSRCFSGDVVKSCQLDALDSSDTGLGQRIMTALALFSTRLAAVVRIVDGRLGRFSTYFF